MNKVVIWVIVGILAIVLVVILMKGKSSSAQDGGGTKEFLGSVDPSGGGYPQGAGAGTGITGLMDQLTQSTQTPTSAKDCNKDCKNLCNVYPKKILCKDRCKCRKGCEKDCTKGDNYKATYPMVPNI